jgi:hypothetical protein
MHPCIPSRSFYMTDPEVWARAFGVINSFLDDAKAGGTPGTTVSSAGRSF